MGRGIRGSAAAGDALALTARPAKPHRGQRRTNGQRRGTGLALLQPSVRPGHGGGCEFARGDTIKDGNLLIQALPALQRESGTVFFTTS